jgi:hypothetical protein
MPTNVNIRQMLTDYNVNQSFDGLKTFKGNIVLGTTSTNSITINSGQITVPQFINFDSNTLYIDGVNNRVSVGTNTPTSTFHVAGSLALSVVTVTSTGTIANTATKIIVNNGITNITLTLPNPSTCPGRTLSFTRAALSTGTITINPGGGQIQALLGTLGLTTSIGAHSATGGGVDIQFWSDGTNWYR